METEKKIIILSPAHPLRGGIAASSERLAREWQAQGARVALYSFSLQYPSLLFPGKTQYTDEPAPKDLAINPLLNSINPLSWWKVGKLIAKERPDILVVRYWLPFLAPALGFVCRKARKNKHTRIISIADNLIPHESRPGDELLTRYFVRSVDAFIVMSRSVGTDLNQLGLQKPWAYVPHPIYDHYGQAVSEKEARQFLNLPSDEKVRYVLFFGFVRRYKGLDLLIDAFADARLRQMPIKLIVAGEFYEDEKKYREQVKALQLEESILFRNEYIPNREIPYYFSASDIVAQPYRSATQSGISQLAYHFKKPMLVTRVGGLPEIVPHGKVGYVTDISSPAIAEALVDFFQNSRKREMEHFVAKYKEQFSWKKLVDKIEELAKVHS